MSLWSLPQNHSDSVDSYGISLQVALSPTQVTLLQVRIPRYFSWASVDLPSLPCPNITSVPHTNTHC